MAASPEDKSVPQLLSELARDTAALVRDEVRLAKGRSNIRSTNLVPERTVRSVQRDAELAKSEVQR